MLGAQFMYWTGWVPSSCTASAGCPVHVLDRLGAQFMYCIGWVPISCTGQAGCPVHGQDRLGTQVWTSWKFVVHLKHFLPNLENVRLQKNNRQNTVANLKQNSLRKGSQCPGYVLVMVAQAMFWKGCLMPRSHSRKGCPGQALERVAQVMFKKRLPRSCSRKGCPGLV